MLEDAIRHKLRIILNCMRVLAVSGFWFELLRTHLRRRDKGHSRRQEHWQQLRELAREHPTKQSNHKTEGSKHVRLSMPKSH